MVTDALVSDTRTDRHLYLRYRLLATLYHNREIGFVTFSVEEDLFPDLNSVRVLEHKRQFLLLTGTEIHVDVAVRLVDAFDPVGTGAERVVQRSITRLQLKRHRARLSFQSLR